MRSTTGENRPHEWAEFRNPCPAPEVLIRLKRSLLRFDVAAKQRP
jgi:hypothetical protein